VRQVSCRIRDNIDQNVLFHDKWPGYINGEYLADSSYEMVQHRFGSRRLATLTIADYSNPVFPISKPGCLRRLIIFEPVHVSAINTLFINGANLKEIKVVLQNPDMDSMRVDWEKLFSHLNRIQNLELINSRNSKRGFPISFIYPIINKSWETLQSVALYIDSRFNPEIDLQIFGNLKVLRGLYILRWEPRSPESDGISPISITPTPNPFVKNCNAVISSNLREFCVYGFIFQSEDVRATAKKIAAQNCTKVTFQCQYWNTSLWHNFETLLRKMGMDCSVRTSIQFQERSYSLERFNNNTPEPGCENMLLCLER